jgi:signal transduction histidine kinase
VPAGLRAGQTMTKASFKWRLMTLGVSVGLMGALIVVVTLDSQRQGEEVHARLEQVDLESFQIADHFKDALRDANERIRHYGSTGDPDAWHDFLGASRALKFWIAQQGPKASTKEEREILAQMYPAYAAYMEKAQELQHRIEASAGSTASLAEYSEFAEQARHFRDLGDRLSRAHFDSRNQVLAGARRTLARLRLSVLGLVGLLFASALVLGVVIYRDLIAPLRVKLVESQALAQRNEKLASLGVLAAGVAHEIRNPLTAVKTALFNQQKKLAPGTALHNDGQVIEREISRLERIVNGFLQFARPNEPELARILAAQPLREVRILLAPQLAEAGIQVDSEIRDDLASCQVKVDPAQLQQVLINLVQNAADSIGREGRVTLRLRGERRAGRNGEREVVILEVADTGAGISREVEKRLFDPFFTTKASGTGLGLSIAARLVEMNGGIIEYQTHLKHGSVFGVVLPRVDL